jgi:hypothetical protein
MPEHLEMPQPVAMPRQVAMAAADVGQGQITRDPSPWRRGVALEKVR